jgi:hypothetical protein
MNDDLNVGVGGRLVQLGPQNAAEVVFDFSAQQFRVNCEQRGLASGVDDEPVEPTAPH